MSANLYRRNGVDDGNGSSDTRLTSALVAMLFVCTIVAYIPALQADFVSYDDGVYVTENAQVQSGLNTDSVRWAFVNGHSGNWQPVTWLSHMIDCELYGQTPGGHHLSNVLLHGVNMVLLFLFLRRLTGNAFPSLFVAMVFALHPLHVESVAWVSERKDVLSTFFAMLTLLAYARYVATSSRLQYALSVLWLALGLMAKPMLVTIPCVLLLLDYWPLARHANPSARNTLRLLFEKLPHFALAIALSFVTLWVQREAHAMSSLEALPLEMRVKNAFYSYVVYTMKAFWPVNLAAYYPHPKESLTWIAAGLAAAVLVAMTLTVILLRKRSPFLPVGWFWYLGTLVPVIGIIQVGRQGLADRYMYFPIIGLTIMVAWGVTQLASSTRAFPKWTLRCLGTAAAVAMAWCTWVQAGYWKDTETLFAHALAVTENNEVAERGLGTTLIVQERYEDALPHLLRATELDPLYAENHYHLGIIHQHIGPPDVAITHFNRAIELDPKYSQAYNNLGVTLMGIGRYHEAEQAISKAVETDPGNSEAVENYAAVLVAVGKHAEAESRLRPLLEQSPYDATLHNNLAAALAAQGKYDEARQHFLQALEFQPDYEQAKRGLDALSKP